MTLLDRIRFQKSIHPKVNEVWLPADEVEALIESKAKADAYMLAANAWFREERRKKRRREAEPQPRRKSIAAQMMEAQANNPKPRV